YAARCARTRRVAFEKDRAALPRQSGQLRERLLELRRLARDRAARNVCEALASGERAPQNERDRERGDSRRGRGPTELMELRAPALRFADLGPRSGLQDVTV